VTLTVSEIQRWDPEAVREVFHSANARATSATQAGLALADLPAFTTWGGMAADAAKDSFGKTRVDLDTHAREALAVAQAAEQAAQDIEKVKLDLQRLEDDAHGAKLEIDPETDKVVPGPGFKGTAQELANATAPMQTRLNAILAEATATDDELAAAIMMADGKLPIPDAPPTPAPPPPKASAADVNKWWTSLTPEQKQAELRDHPEIVGNLNGVPVAARSDANLRVMRHDLETVDEAARRAGVSPDDIVKDPTKYGLTATDVTRFQNATEVQTGLQHDAGPRGTNPTFLMAYDPTAFGGKGRAAIAIGNPDTAKNTSVIVPGTSSSVKGGWLHDNHDDALHLYSESQVADPNASTAVIAWMGYDAPNDFQDPGIATPWLARTGAASLAADVNGLSVTHLGADHITVLGHSYGSTTVADAAVMGMQANDVVLLGCPGTDMAQSAADFNLAPGAHVYVGDASTDPVGWLGEGQTEANWLNQKLHYPLGPLLGLGADPAAEGFGATRFHAEVPGADGINPHDHSHYYASGSESLRAMTDIASGHSERLATDGLIAESRHQPTVSTPDHIDIPGIGRVDIPHTDIPIFGTPAIIDPEADRPSESVKDNHGYQ
jgi:pimeloyl-ACP methyl ester carboxylesterase